MVRGFQTDHTHGAILRTNWTEGEPQPLKVLGMTAGVKGAKDALRLPITLFRCPLCGYLESYALHPELSQK